MSLVRFRPEAPSSPTATLVGKPNASVAHLVERHLAKVEVASSSLVTRSKFFGALCGSIWCHSQVVRQSSAKAPLPSSNLGGTSRKRHDFCRVFLLFAPVLSQKLGAGDEPGSFIMQKSRSRNAVPRCTSMRWKKQNHKNLEIPCNKSSFPCITRMTGDGSQCSAC